MKARGLDSGLVPGDLTDTEYGACPGCGARLRLIFDTIDGQLEERLSECRTCRPSRFVVIPAGHKALTCKGCTRTFTEPIKRGRYHHYCPECRS